MDYDLSFSAARAWACTSAYWGRRRMLLVGAVSLSALLPRVSEASAASLTGKDVQIIAKALGFLTPPSAGGTVAVVYSAAAPASKADAEAIALLFGGGVSFKGGSIGAKVVDLGTLGDAAGYVAIIVAEGVQGDAPLRASKARKIPSVTGSTALVQSGLCIMSVKSDPKVEITVNRDAAQSAGIGFDPAFRMLIHEI